MERQDARKQSAFDFVEDIQHPVQQGIEDRSIPPSVPAEFQAGRFSSNVIRSPSACRQKLSVEALLMAGQGTTPFLTYPPDIRVKNMALLR